MIVPYPRGVNNKGNIRKMGGYCKGNNKYCFRLTGYSKKMCSPARVGW
jgi:hypothetical protein